MVIPHVACNQPLGGALLGSDWLLLSVLALTASTLALSIVYMFASFLRNTQLLTWTKFELFQLFGTAVFIAFFATVVAGMCTFDMSWLDSRYHAEDNMYKIIDNYFSRLEDLGYLLFGYIMYISKLLSYMSRVTVHSSPMGVGSSENPLESMSQLNSLLFVMLSTFVTSFLLLELQMRALDYLAFACLGYLFPMGIFFRCFEPTRSFGGTLLGLSVALFLFYPIIMVFNDYLIYSQISDLQSSVVPQLQSANANVANNNAANSGNAEQGVTQGFSLSWYEGLWGAASAIVLTLFKPIMVYVIAAVVLPIINFIVLVEITRGATAFMGDELDVSNLTRMI
jgi:hypothetical protein